MTQKNQILTVNPLQDNRWDRFIEAHQFGSIYHHSCWMKVIEKTYRYKPHYLALLENNNQIQAVLPLFYIDSRLTGKRFISVPFSPYAGPLAHDHHGLNSLCEEVERRANDLKAKYVQLRCWVDSLPLNENKYQAVRHYKVHLLDLSPEIEGLLSSFHKNCIRRPISKSLKNGLRLKVAESEKDVDEFYRLQVKTRKKHGIPPQPKKYFCNMWEILKPLGYIKILMAYYNSHVAAAIILLQFKDTVIYQNGGSDAKFLWLKPNHFLLWKAIEMAKIEGFQNFNFGKSSPRDHGLIQFKQRWGTKEYFLYNYYYPKNESRSDNLEASIKYRFATSIFGNLPEYVLKKVGEITYKHIA